MLVVVEEVYGLGVLVVVLLVGELHFVEGGFHAEVEEGVGDVVYVVVVDCRGDDVCGEVLISGEVLWVLFGLWESGGCNYARSSFPG